MSYKSWGQSSPFEQEVNDAFSGPGVTIQSPGKMEGKMDKGIKRPYIKPSVTKISLDARCAVLGFCKVSGKTGPGQPGNCTVPATCYASGS